MQLHTHRTGEILGSCAVLSMVIYMYVVDTAVE